MVKLEIGGAMFRHGTGLVLPIIVCHFVALCMTVRIAARAAMDKGYSDIVPKLWFMGIFGLALTPVVVVAALPDRGDGKRYTTARTKDELPPI